MTEFPQTLKSWRAARRYSQLDLAHEAEISGRHLSFLETGRAKPSRDMVLRLSEALQLPLDARNLMLTHAGFAAQYPGRNWSENEMSPIRKAVDRMLLRHSPYPGLALDRYWRILQMNRPAAALFGQLGVGEGDSLVDLMMSETMPDVVENWPEVAHHAAHRLRVESLAQGGIPEFDRAVAHLSLVGAAAVQSGLPVIPTVIRAGDLRLSMFATIAQFGTPDDVTLDDLKIELYYPTDNVTQITFETLAAA